MPDLPRVVSVSAGRTAELFLLCQTAEEVRGFANMGGMVVELARVSIIDHLGTPTWIWDVKEYLGENLPIFRMPAFPMKGER